MISYGACFHFIGLLLLQDFDRKCKENVQKALFKGSSYKMSKVKNYFLVNIYFIYRYSKIKNNTAFFKLEAFNCKVSFYRLTLKTVIIILRMKFEVKCYCLS